MRRVHDLSLIPFPGRLFAASSVLKVFRREAAQWRFKETGGVLFGYRTGDNDIVVTEATGPGPRAKHGWLTFEPDTGYCQKLLERIYQDSKGAISYIGDWHTHPHCTVRPSSIDVASMVALARDADVRQSKPVLWIFRPGDELLGCHWREANGAYVFDSTRNVIEEANVSWFD